MLLFIGRGLHGDCLVFEFQNILCYCLSVAKSVHEPPFLKFQNILCYCLSYIRFIQKELIYISKHLMLLFIPEKIPTSKHSEYFKTSYVIVYPISGIYYPHRTVISKHLMLLFINDADYIFVRDEIISKHLMLLFIFSPSALSTGNTLFQNISCYCLSLAFPRFLVSPLPFFPLYFLYFSIFYQPTPLS